MPARPIRVLGALTLAASTALLPFNPWRVLLRLNPKEARCLARAVVLPVALERISCFLEDEAVMLSAMAARVWAVPLGLAFDDVTLQAMLSSQFCRRVERTLVMRAPGCSSRPGEPLCDRDVYERLL
jgi:hypothetical protein